MSVVLEPPLTRSGVNPWAPHDWGQPLTTGPRYVRGAEAGRWHRPRSGVRHGEKIWYRQWCGSSVHADRDGFRTADQVPAGDLVCGAVAPMRASGGAYNPTWGLTNHPPGEDLIPGCPFHAWRELDVIDGRVACRCRRGEGAA